MSDEKPKPLTERDLAYLRGEHKNCPAVKLCSGYGLLATIDALKAERGGPHVGGQHQTRFAATREEDQESPEYQAEMRLLEIGETAAQAVLEAAVAETQAEAECMRLLREAEQGHPSRRVVRVNRARQSVEDAREKRRNVVRAWRGEPK